MASKLLTTRETAARRTELAFEAAYRMGWDRVRTMSELGISRTTYYELRERLRAAGSFATASPSYEARPCSPH